ncbi:MAG: NB-ARC domain-containing protein [Pseudomonadota bacterium]
MEYDEFAIKVRVWLDAHPDRQGPFRKAVAKQFYRGAFSRNEHQYHKSILPKIKDLTGSEIPTWRKIKGYHNGEIVREFEGAIPLYYLVKVDSQYNSATLPIERAIFDRGKSFESEISGNADTTPGQPLSSLAVSAESAIARLCPSYPVRPDLGNHYQSGRAEFHQIKSVLLRGAGGSKPATAAIYGAGGYGKTAIGEELCLDPDVKAAFPGGIYWFEFGMREGDAGEGRFDFTPVEAAIEGMLREQYGSDAVSRLAIQDPDALIVQLPEDRLLLIADDVWNERQARWMRELEEHVSVLVMTRSRSIAHDRDVQVLVDRLSRNASLKLLTAGMPTLDPVQAKRLQGVSDGFNGWALILRLANGRFRAGVRSAALSTRSWRNMRTSSVTRTFRAGMPKEPKMMTCRRSVGSSRVTASSLGCVL